jgi:TonB family protein
MSLERHVGIAVILAATLLPGLHAADLGALPTPDGETITFPELVPESRVNPAYPDAAREKRAAGIVLFDAEIRADGSVGNLAPIHFAPEGLGFETTAAAAVKQWRYRPARREDAPIAVRFPVLVEFKVKSGGVLAPAPDVRPFWRSCRSRGLEALRAGRLDEAERYLRHALTDTNFLPSSPYQGAISRKDLAELLLARGRARDAERPLAEALSVFEKMMKDTDPDLRFTLAKLGELRAERGAAAEALPLLERALAAEEAAKSGDAALVPILRAQEKALRALGREAEATAAAARADRLSGGAG